MRFIKPEKLTELEKLLITALINSCPPGCSHEGCSRRLNGQHSYAAYERGIAEANKYKDVPGVR